MDPVVHFEMPYDDRERAAKFYAAVFGWAVRMHGEDMGNYMVVRTGQPGEGPPPMEGTVPGVIGGGFFKRNTDWPAQHPSVVIAVRDIQASMKKVNEAGGEVLGEPMPIPGIGDNVAFYDTEKNRVSMLQPAPMPAR
jgi:predicted enzyme related to lactoylglutathione lyase